MMSEQNEIVSGSARLRAERPRIIESSQAERVKTGKVLLSDANKVDIMRSHQTQRHFAEVPPSSIWKLISSAWLANYWVTSYDTDPITWVLGCTNSEASDIIPIVVFDTLEEAQTLFYRLAKARALKACVRVDI